MSTTDIALGALVNFPVLVVLIAFLPLYLVLKTPPIRPKGCRRLGLPPGQSNLDDEFDPKYGEGFPSDQKDQGRRTWRVKALFTYPLKSCGAVELQLSNVVPAGLEFDRQF